MKLPSAEEWVREHTVEGTADERSVSFAVTAARSYARAALEAAAEVADQSCLCDGVGCYCCAIAAGIRKLKEKP